MDIVIADKANRFIAAYRALLTAAALNEPAIGSFLDALKDIDAREAGDHSSTGTPTHPALRHLDRAVEQLRGDADSVRAIRDVIPHLCWGGSYESDGPVGAVAQRMVWGEVVGRNGLLKSEAIKLGLFLLSPGMIYPLHGHNALEIYSVVSGAMTVVQGLDHPASTLVEAPGHSVTPEGEAHALHVGLEPVLIVYCWTGDLAAPVWWWDRGVDGAWTKLFPAMVQRIAQVGSWKHKQRES